ncbi:putative bifunctional diguanylate cyclase/phosphodiesterase [Massilia suwonensis]|uniref:Bifunctional diguanylate cyclase/phosphodiesterase n=1 Tax=Massilia suwonensis TaxID=648895 RepID=A0ABW0MJ75_9BURK
MRNTGLESTPIAGGMGDMRGLFFASVGTAGDPWMHAPGVALRASMGLGILFKPAVRRGECPTADGTAWVPACERRLAGLRFNRQGIVACSGNCQRCGVAAATRMGGGSVTNQVLIISSRPDDVRALKRALGNASDGPFVVRDLSTLAQALERIRHGGIDAILMDMMLPDSEGLPCFDQVHEAARHTPIMMLCGEEEEPAARETVQRGAQGWLSRGYFDNSLLPQSLRNVIERMKVEQGAYLALARAQITLDSIGDGVISVDMHGRVDYLNVAAEEMTGWSGAEADGRPVAEVLVIVDAASGEPAVNPVGAVLESGHDQALEREVVLVGRHGVRKAIDDSAAPIFDWNDRIVGAVMVFRDISATVALTSTMRHLAQHDFLTKLPNRVLLNDRITQAIAMARRGAAGPALLFLDLDKFKHINDSLGHDVGDRLLQAVAARLLDCVRLSDTVSRHGGDEFVILLADERRPHAAALAAEKILIALSTPFLIEGQQLHTSTSIGISVFPADGVDAGALIRNADTAMYHAKERGRNNYQFFSQDMNARAVERQLIETHLRLALERHEFTLHYQPKLDLESCRITGVEALLRWNHPEWGMTLPERFIRIAEECGLIIPIGRWILREACAQSVRWRDSGLAPVSIAINVSALEFRHRDFFTHATAVFTSSGVAPACLQLELTESVLMRDVAASAELLTKFKAIGVEIAVDDFGTGYSSLSYLNQFPIDVLKIDQSFVRAIDGTLDGNGAIVSAVIGMGRSLNQRVIAEGIENATQLDFLRLHGCSEGQGYFFSKPVDATRMREMLLG